MTNTTKTFSMLALVAAHLVFTACKQAPTEASEATQEIVQVNPLPSWHDGKSKSQLMAFVEAVTQENGPYYVAPADRIATFDNDGTLWSEQPAYFQLIYSIDLVKKMAPEHPEWAKDPVFKAVLDDDMKAVMASGHAGLGKILMATNAGMTVDAYTEKITDWLATAKHPTKNKAYNELIYQPMLELIQYLSDNDFKVFIVSGGMADFMRPWASETYGIPTERIVGSTLKVVYTEAGELELLPEFDLIDDKAGKPVGIHKYIGKRPIAAFGNSDGDLQMLQYTAAGAGKRLMAFVHHTDAEREWAYDRDSHIGKFDKGLDEAQEKGWTLIDMKNDWKTVFPE